ncbi:hypothetical protein BU23DRAFT_551822 [Bimuria novae-zelandiae CBS 107.79]|uniref:Uncharacterized protein n=1 Tax=Bimuria novae-zelandiae CBS 107.79 TaxID=1447943 RepID=A0A6A5VI79_9PLEO|nr:hypothetical protein BU23DRAFT_551822 [Bimuria novae-zelandiae CBS 107.79]
MEQADIVKLYAVFETLMKKIEKAEAPEGAAALIEQFRESAAALRKEIEARDAEVRKEAHRLDEVRAKLAQDQHNLGLREDTLRRQGQELAREKAEFAA